jgi:toluene monooxygenase electron transfer component
VDGGSVKIHVNARNGASSFLCEPGEKILLAGLRAGIWLPYECGTGTCGTCKARLVEGDVADEWPDAPGRTSLRQDAGECLMCQSVARTDCTLEIAGAAKAMAADACVPTRLDAVIRRVVPLTHDVVLLELDLPRPLDFDAGQFVLMTVAGITGSRAYSMVNYERGARRLVLVVKKKPGGGLSEWLFGGPVAGVGVSLFGPLGAATFRPDVDRNLLCVAGGSGIAGMMSILAHATQSGHFERHTGDVFFGVRTRRDVFFLEALADFQARAPEALRVTIALSDEDVDPSLVAQHPRCGFGKGFVHAVAGERMQGRFANVRAYAAGPPPMVNATLRMLLLQGKLKPDEIRYDKFS